MTYIISIVLWSIFIILLVVLIGCIINYTNYKLYEGFGIQCIDYIPFKQYNIYPPQDDTIFVSIASYRDDECSLTLNTLYKYAKYPEKVYIGICEQNKKGELQESCLKDPSIIKYKDNIRVYQLDYTEAKGPTYARYYCSKLWRGETYYLQIDSHVFFTSNWDQELIGMIKTIKNNPEESNKPVISVYPPTYEQMKIEGFPEFDNGRINENNIPTFLCGWSKESDVPRRSNKSFIAAGFMFLESKFLYEVPFDPNLSHLFQLEETLLAARLWTNGWDFYTPNKKIAYHHYNRTKAPLYHKDNPKGSECRQNAEKRGLFLLGLLPKESVIEDFLKDYNYYGLGKFRSIEDYWKSNGMNFVLKTVEKWNDDNPPSVIYNGWWFRRDGYKFIKKIG